MNTFEVRKKKLSFLFLVIIFIFLVAGPAMSFSPETASFSIKIKNFICPFNKFAVFVVPGEKILFEIFEEKDAFSYIAEATAGSLEALTSKKWCWQSPCRRGLHFITIKAQPSFDVMCLNLFVMLPYKELKEEHLNGYRIGSYPLVSTKPLAIYGPPKGFIEVMERNQNTPVSPHFTLKQFLCKQPGRYPKYIVLNEKLLLKLEMILQKINEKGIHCQTFNIMSGYRTPYYNKKIGNVKYSRHLWGGAADIYIDESPKDQLMDDLNRDGKISHKDAKILFNIIDSLYNKDVYSPFLGGLAFYENTSHHGPFVHVDIRGKRARWGLCLKENAFER